MSHPEETGEEKESRVEKILNQEVTLDTPVLDFLLIVGWDARWYWKNPLYEKSDSRTQKGIQSYIAKRRGNISMSEMNRETRFCHLVHSSPNYNHRQIITLRELKKVLETEGVLLGKNVKYKTIAHLNETLSEYGLAPFKIGGKRSPSAKALKKYGLEKSEL